MLHSGRNMDQVLPLAGMKGQCQLLTTGGISNEMLQTLGDKDHIALNPAQIHDDIAPSPVYDNRQTWDAEYLDIDTCFYDDSDYMDISSSPTSLSESITTICTQESMLTMTRVDNRHSSVSSVNSSVNSTPSSPDDGCHSSMNCINGNSAYESDDIDVSPYGSDVGVLETNHSEKSGDVYTTWEPHGKECKDRNTCQGKCLGGSNLIRRVHSPFKKLVFCCFWVLLGSASKHFLEVGCNMIFPPKLT